jgi:hypothetical protein
VEVLVIDPADCPDGEVFVADDGREVEVPYDLAHAVAEQVAPGDIRAAGLALHALADEMFAAGPKARPEVIERRAVAHVRRKLVIWNLTCPETFYRIGVGRRPPCAVRVPRPAVGRRPRRRVRVGAPRRGLARRDDQAALTTIIRRGG